MMTQAVEKEAGGEGSNVSLSLRTQEGTSPRESSDSGIFSGTQFPRSVNFRGRVT